MLILNNNLFKQVNFTPETGPNRAEVNKEIVMPPDSLAKMAIVNAEIKSYKTAYEDMKDLAKRAKYDEIAKKIDQVVKNDCNSKNFNKALVDMKMGEFYKEMFLKIRASKDSNKKLYLKQLNKIDMPSTSAQNYKDAIEGFGVIDVINKNNPLTNNIDKSKSQDQKVTKYKKVIKNTNEKTQVDKS